MPQVNYVYQARKINITRNMPTPHRIGELRYWLRGAQTAILEIPRKIAESEYMVDNRDLGHDGWFVMLTDSDVKWIRFNLQNRFGATAQIVINRKLGGGVGY